MSPWWDTLTRNQTTTWSGLKVQKLFSLLLLKDRRVYIDDSLAWGLSSIASYPGSSLLFNVRKTYHARDVVSGTNLTWFHLNCQVGSTHYVTHVISFTRLSHFSYATLKSSHEPGYEICI